jgi:hypothetical protein
MFSSGVLTKALYALPFPPILATFPANLTLSDDYL